MCSGEPRGSTQALLAEGTPPHTGHTCKRTILYPAGYVFTFAPLFQLTETCVLAGVLASGQVRPPAASPRTPQAGTPTLSLGPSQAKVPEAKPHEPGLPTSPPARRSREWGGRAIWSNEVCELFWQLERFSLKPWERLKLYLFIASY